MKTKEERINKIKNANIRFLISKKRVCFCFQIVDTLAAIFLNEMVIRRQTEVYSYLRNNMKCG